MMKMLLRDGQRKRQTEANIERQRHFQTGRQAIDRNGA